ncbi:MAG: DNA pilot protein [Microviridae sp.]|nr:MAG: DNA pilot protein [Microviridae sp.]
MFYVWCNRCVGGEPPHFDETFHDRFVCNIFGIDDMLIGAAISGLGSVATNFFNKSNVEDTNATNRQNVLDTNEANSKQAQLNRDFQERMSNSAWQRGMEDMGKAGLNPILAYQKGGASSPTGAQAALTAPHAQSFKADNPMEGAVNTGMALRRANQEILNMQEQGNLLHAQTFQARSQAVKNQTDAIKTAADTDISRENLSPAQLNALKAKIDMPVYQNSAGRIARQTGTAAEEVNRTAEPLVNNATKLIRGVTSFNSRFHY